jgi:hypothetical protein
MTLPNFLCIGAQKAGSTWIHNRLGQHPDVFVPPDAKELQYFSRPSNPRRLKAYQAHFSTVDGERWIGESTPGYFWTADETSEFYQPGWRRCENIPQAVLDLLGPDVRLLLSLRHPVDRAISAFYHHFRQGRIKPEESILDAGRRLGIIDMGFYQRHFQKWHQVFPKEQFHVSFLEQIKTDPEVLWRDICEFLNIADSALQAPDKADNRGLRLRVQNGVVEVDSDDATDVESGWRQWLQKMFPKRSELQSSPRITTNELRILHDMYKPDIEFVMSQLGGEGLDWADTPAQILNRK